MLILSVSNPILFVTPSQPVDSELERSQEQLQQIDGVIWEILTTGIPESPERLQVIIVILSKTSCIQDARMRFNVRRLRQVLIQIVSIY